MAVQYAKLKSDIEAVKSPPVAFRYTSVDWVIFKHSLGKFGTALSVHFIELWLVSIY
jgi:hypothetical protein